MTTAHSWSQNFMPAYLVHCCEFARQNMWKIFNALYCLSILDHCQWSFSKSS